MIQESLTLTLSPPRPLPGPNKRIDYDVRSLYMSDFKLDLIDENKMNKFIIEFHGPKDSFYEGGLWKIRTEIPDSYPYRPPSFFFVNKIYHPNIDESTGAVCMNEWICIYNLVHVFEMYIPLLLLYPNTEEPLNAGALALMNSDKPAFVKMVKDYIKEFSMPPPEEKSSVDEIMSDNSDDENSDDEESDDPIAEVSDDLIVEVSDDQFIEESDVNPLPKTWIFPTKWKIW